MKTALLQTFLKQTRFATASELEGTLTNYLSTYNNHIPQRALNYLSPIETLQNWRKKSLTLFVKRIYRQAELDTYAQYEETCRM